MVEVEEFLAGAGGGAATVAVAISGIATAIAATRIAPALPRRRAAVADTGEGAGQGM